MSIEVKVSNLDTVIAELGVAEDRLEKAAVYAIAQVGLALQRDIRLSLNNNPHKRVGKSWFPSEHVGGPKTPPNRRTGHLLNSVQTDVREGFGTYTVKVAPGMIYARMLEETLDYPYMRPAADRLRPKANEIFMTNFLKKWR